MNVVITSVSRKVSLIRAFQEALAAEGDGHVIGVDVSPTAVGLYMADEHYLVPRSDDAAFIPTLLDLCTKHGVRLVVPTRDEELPVLAKARGEFLRAGVRIMVPPVETVEICQDKLRFAEFCARNGLGAPEIRDSPENGPFPVFVKPRHGKGGKGTFLVRSRVELDGALARLGGDAIVQEFIDAPEYTIDLFADFSGNVISVVPRQRILVVGGESYVSCTVKDIRLRNEAIRLAKALRLEGHNTIQCFLKGDQVKFIEVNARYGGAAALGFAAGAKTPLDLVRIVNGKQVEPHVDDFQEGLFMLRYTQDLFLDRASLTGRAYRR